MKIALLLPSLANKAPIIMALDLAREYKKKGIDVAVFYLSNIVELNFPCTVYKLNFATFRLLLDFDLIHSHMLRPDLLSAFVKFSGRKSRVHISTIHSIYDADLRNSHSRILSLVAGVVWICAWRIIRNVVVLNNYSKLFYADKLSGCDIRVVYNGRRLPRNSLPMHFDLERIKLIKASSRIIGSCAGISKIKGFDQVLRALPFLPEYHFLLIGDGPELNNLVKLSIQLGVSDRFTCLGYKANATDYLEYFDVFVMSSRAEGMPLALIEAVASRVPVVCSRIGQLAEIFSNEELCFFELDSIESFVNSVHEIEVRKDLYVSKAFNKYMLSYTSEVMADNYLSIYESASH